MAVPGVKLAATIRVCELYLLFVFFYRPTIDASTGLTLFTCRPFRVKAMSERKMAKMFFTPKFCLTV
jgi:hypothetical protein